MIKSVVGEGRSTVGARDGSTVMMKSPTGALAGQLSRNLLIKSPVSHQTRLTALPQHMQVVRGATAKGKGVGSKVCKTSSLLASAMRFNSGNDGLNSILDGSPDPIPGTAAVHARVYLYMSLAH